MNINIKVCSKVCNIPRNLFNQGCNTFEDSEYSKNISIKVIEAFEQIKEVSILVICSLNVMMGMPGEWKPYGSPPHS